MANRQSSLKKNILNFIIRKHLETLRKIERKDKKSFAKCNLLRYK